MLSFQPIVHCLFVFSKKIWYWAGEGEGEREEGRGCVEETGVRTVWKKEMEKRRNQDEERMNEYDVQPTIPTLPYFAFFFFSSSSLSPHSPLIITGGTGGSECFLLSLSPPSLLACLSFSSAVFGAAENGEELVVGESDGEVSIVKIPYET
jgi:hypothetical protein